MRGCSGSGSEGHASTHDDADAGDGTGDLILSGDALFGPAVRQNACVEAAPVSVPADAAACAAIAGTDLDTANACDLVLTDDPDDGDMARFPFFKGPSIDEG